MAINPAAAYLPIDYTGVPLMARYDVVCAHTIVGNDPAAAAHFSVRSDGFVTQSRDTAYQSAANYEGNHRVIAIETDDMGPEFGAWNINDGHAVPAWTTAQCEAIARILVWCHRTHGIPLTLAPDSRPTSRGIGYHRQGIDGNFAGYAYPAGRVSGGERWSKVFGKVCPGDRRIRQLIEIVIPRARVLAGLEEDDVDWTDPLIVTAPGERTYKETHPAGQIIGDTFYWVSNLNKRYPKLDKLFDDVEELKARPPAIVDPSALQDPAFVRALAVALADEMDRRARDSDPATGPTS